MTGTTPDGWSAYDEAVPHVTGLPDLTARLDELRPRRPGPEGATLADVADVVVVVSSSRGGSSLFGELLRQIPGLLHLRAEINPFFALAGLYDGAERRRVLEAELLADIGRPARPGDRPDRERYASDVTWRLLVQWPSLAAVPLDELIDRVGREVDHHPVDDAPAMLRRVLAALHPTHPELHAGYYDLPDGPDHSDRPAGRPAPSGPPGPALVEMPPFVVPGLWRPADRDELQRWPLVLTTPRNAFRLEFLADLFPAARIRVLHLTRNPAASINGLVDGWLHHGFFNCTVPLPLRIAGYSDVVPGGDRWWCYDLPPGWEDWVDRPLVEVCAFQWRATHAAAVDGTARFEDVLRVGFESLVGPPAVRRPALDRLAAWLGVDAGALHHVAGAELPVVMATERPRPGRWRARVDELRPVLDRPDVVALAGELGYCSEADWD